jgi:3-deoxy-D-manno-octulosonic-acid transferase
MTLIYNLVFLLFVLVSLPRAIKRRFANEEYKGMLSRRLFTGKIDWVSEKPKVWLNGVSVGEIISLGPLVGEYEERYPGIRLYITATTGTGYQRIRSLYPKHMAGGMPLDFSWLVRRRITKVSPDMIVSVELDLWPNFLTACARMKVPFCVVSGRISESSSRGYAKVKALMSEPFSAISLFLGQDRVDTERAVEMGIKEENVKVGGNLKFDLLKTEKADLEGPLKELSCDKRSVLVLASTHKPEENWLLDALDKVDFKGRKDWRLIMAARHPERRDELVSLLKQKGWGCCLYSDWVKGRIWENNEILLIDRLGVLSSLYALADLAFIGGSLIPHGGQNMIEPAAVGCPVLYGPHVFNFREAHGILEDCDGSFTLSGREELVEKFSTLLENKELRVACAARARTALLSRQGVAKRNLDILSHFN